MYQKIIIIILLFVLFVLFIYTREGFNNQYPESNYTPNTELQFPMALDGRTTYISPDSKGNCPQGMERDINDIDSFPESIIFPTVELLVILEPALKILDPTLDAVFDIEFIEGKGGKEFTELAIEDAAPATEDAAPATEGIALTTEGIALTTEGVAFATDVAALVNEEIVGTVVVTTVGILIIY